MPALSDTRFARPLVYVTPLDFARLSDVVGKSAPTDGGSALLREELSRMMIASEDDPNEFVRLGSRVVYKDLRTKRVRSVRVVPPAQADGDENLVSVLSPIGAALIGLGAGAIFRWISSDGSTRAIKLIEVGT